MRWSLKKHSIKMLIMLVIGCILLTIPAFAAASSGTHTPIDGVTVSVSGATDNSITDGAITVTAKGSAGFFGIGASKKTATITIDNSLGKKANVSFGWTATNVNQLTIDGTVYSTTSGIFSKALEIGGSLTITIVTDTNNTENKLVMSGFAIEEVKDGSTITITYDSTLGNVTVGGTAVANNGSVSITGETALVAAPKSGAKFVAWMEANNKVLSKSATYTISPTGDKTIKALFSNTQTDAWFDPDDGFLYDDLNEAVTKGSKVVPVNDGTLPAGSYTIPSGVTLLIPFDDANTNFTVNHDDNGGLVGGGTSCATGAYRTLTMADGADITVNGVLSLPAKINAPGGGKTNAGAPTGKVPYIQMQGSSSITLNDGAYLYCYGFITGSGSVMVNNGATVYECFQIRDYRGGSGSSSIKNVFPTSQYYIQNVEVPMIFQPGGTLIGVSAVTVSIVGTVYMDNIAVIGTSDSLFSNSGRVTKTYDGSTDRLVIDVDGNASLGSIALDFGNWGASIDSANFVLGLNNNMTINIVSGTTTVNQRLAMQPGTILNIADKAEVTLNKNVYVYDADQWGDYIYAESISDGIEHPSTESMQDANNYAMIPVAFAPGKQYTRSINALVDAQIDVNGTLTATAANLYTTSSGASILSSEGTGKVVISAGTETITYQADMNSSSNLSYYEIPITSAKLKNGDATYVQTSGTAAETIYTYCTTCGTWLCPATQNVCAAAIMSADGTTTLGNYHTLQGAVSTYSGTGYIQMLTDSTRPCTIESDMTVPLDLNGCNVTGVTLSGTLYGADSSSNGFQTPKGSIAVSGNGSVAPAAMLGTKGYVAVETNNVYQFHRFAITPISCCFYLNSKSAPTHSHLAFKAALQGSDEAISKIKDLGFVINDEPLWYGKAPVYTNLTADEEFSDYKTVSLVAVDYAGTEGFDTPYTITARAAFDDNHMELISGAAVPTVSMSAALEKAGITIR